MVNKVEAAERLEDQLEIKSEREWPSLDERQREKQASREDDAYALASGKKTRDQLRHENGLIRIARIDWDSVRAPR